jgi:hypothetical protein
MSDEDSAAHLTALLDELRQGREAARDQLVTLVYPELRRIAAHYLKQERPDHTLVTTADTSGVTRSGP